MVDTPFGSPEKRNAPQKKPQPQSGTTHASLHAVVNRVGAALSMQGDWKLILCVVAILAYVIVKLYG